LFEEKRKKRKDVIALRPRKTKKETLSDESIFTERDILT
jgi:hypothetical protein